MEMIGTIIEGRWNNNRYIIKELVGKGGIGRVYRVIDFKSDQEYALKISENLESITKESDMLSRLKNMDCLPSIIDIDDYKYEGNTYYFIVLEYIKGQNLKEYILRNRVDIKEVLGVVIIIGEFIKELHRKGYALGDLKPENVMVDINNKKIKIIDFGGITPIGNSLGEFTLLYDRSRWSMGLRRADEGYDLFSICMLIIFTIIKDEKRISQMSIFEILKELSKKSVDKEIVILLQRGLMQEDIDFSKFCTNLKNTYRKVDSRSKKSKGEKVDVIVNTYFLGCLICFFAILFIIIMI